MMEMIKEWQQAGDLEPDHGIQTQTGVARIFQILKQSLSEPVIAVYRTKLQASLDLTAIVNILETTHPEIDTKDLTEKQAVELLDLEAWFSLILQRWDVFETILKNTGKNAVENLMEVYIDQSEDGSSLSTREARNIAISAHEMLNEFYCREEAGEVALIRDQLLELIQTEDKAEDSLPAEVSTPANDDDEKAETGSAHWVGKSDQETLETPISAQTELKIAAPPFSTNTNGLHEKISVEPSSNGASDQDAPAVRIDKSRTHRVSPPSAQSVLQVEIVKRQGQAMSRKIDITKPSVLIGRSLMADIEVSDPRVSRMHLLIAGTLDKGIMVTDLQSANGTMIDDTPITPNTPTPWDIGQSLTIGETILILRYTE